MTNPGQKPFDPFEQGDGVKAVSFKNAPVNSFVTIQIDDDAKWLHSRDFETGELAYWPARPNETPNPIMAAVITGTLAETPWTVQSGQAGERRSIWAVKPSSMFTAIQNAKRAAGGGTPVPILAGGTLDVAFTGEEPNQKNPNLNNIKVFQARYTPPPAGFGQQDAFEGNQAYTGQQAPAAQQPAAQPFAQQTPAPQQQPQFAQGGYVQQPQQQQQAPAAQPQQPAAAPFGQQPQQQFAQQAFGQQAPAQQAFGQQAPAGDPWAQQAPQQQQAPAAQPQQPAMAGAPAGGGDPWASAPSQDVPNF